MFRYNLVCIVLDSLLDIQQSITNCSAFVDRAKDSLWHSLYSYIVVRDVNIPFFEKQSKSLEVQEKYRTWDHRVWLFNSCLESLWSFINLAFHILLNYLFTAVSSPAVYIHISDAIFESSANGRSGEKTNSKSI